MIDVRIIQIKPNKCQADVKFQNEVKKIDITFQEDDFYAQRPILLERWYVFRKTDWATKIEYPEITLKQIQQLLSIVPRHFG